MNSNNSILHTIIVLWYALWYAEYCGCWSHTKSFKIGEQVIPLISNSHKKLYARLSGPVIIKEQRGPNSYTVESEEAFRCLHLNKLQKFKRPVDISNFSGRPGLQKIREIPKIFIWDEGMRG